MDTIMLTIEGRSFPIARTPMSRLAQIGALAPGRAFAEAIYWGAKRAEPQTTITADWIDENIDSANAKGIYEAWGEFNRSPGAASGEATAASPS